MAYSISAQPNTFELRKIGILKKAAGILSLSVLAAFGVAYYSLLNGFYNPTFSLISIFIVMGMGFFVPRLGDTTAGVLSVVVAGGLLGFAVVPTLAAYISIGKVAIVLQALLASFVIFASMFAYAAITKKDFTNIGGFLAIAMIAAVVMGLLNVFLFHSPMIALIMSYVVALVSCGLILFRVSYAVNGGETSAVNLAFGLLIDLYNLFISILNILGNRE